MDINEGVRLVNKYVNDRKGVRADLNALKVIVDTRQQEMLKEAVRVAVEYYKGIKIII
tara:strand:+ start:317 stop:490 length:174 start_codon:yes stop_codon:yes gene_type:complete